MNDRAELIFHPDTLKRNVLYNQNVFRVQGWLKGYGKQKSFRTPENPLV